LPAGKKRKDTPARRLVEPQARRYNQIRPLLIIGCGAELYAVMSLDLSRNAGYALRNGLARARSVGLAAFAIGKSFSPFPKWLKSQTAQVV
jgi:hypothetical protein